MLGHQPTPEPSVDLIDSDTCAAREALTKAARVGKDDLVAEYAAQYYVAGRLTARAELIPIYGNLLHHAVEMFLKAALLDRSLWSVGLRDARRDAVPAC